MAPKKETELVPSRAFGDPFALMGEMTSEFAHPDRRTLRHVPRPATPAFVREIECSA